MKFCCNNVEMTFSSYFNKIILQWSTDGHNCSLQRFCSSGGPLPCGSSSTVVMSWCCSLLLSYCWNNVAVVWLQRWSHVASSSRSNVPVCRYRTAGLDPVGQLDHHQTVSIGLNQCYYSPPCVSETLSVRHELMQKCQIEGPLVVFRSRFRTNQFISTTSNCSWQNQTVVISRFDSQSSSFSPQRSDIKTLWSSDVLR